MPKLFGREPALWLSLVSTGVKLLSAFVLHLTDGQQTVVNAVVAAGIGLAIAFMVHDGQVAAVLGFVQAALALAVGFGLNVSAENQALIMSFVGTAAAAFVRTQVVAPVPADPQPATPGLT